MILANFKKGIIVFIMFCIILSVIPLNSSAAALSDITNHWAQGTIQRWVDQGLIKGYPDGSFRPNNNITRAEFITLVNKVYGYTSTVPITFTDVKRSDWYYNSVAIAVAAGYISGYPDGTMKPDNPISRKEAASFIMKINKLAINEEAANVFTDSANFSCYKGAIGAVFAANIMKGYPDGSFGFQKFIKRGEAIVALDRAGCIVNVSAITVIGTNNATTVTNGGSLHMYATIIPSNATNKTVKWSVAPTTGLGAGSATIDATGLLSGTKNGTVVVTAIADNNIKGSVTITVITPNADQAPPTGLSVVMPTTLGGSDGQITGVDTTMEYKLATTSFYIAIKDTKITGLSTGVYSIRYAARTGFNAGKPAIIIIPQESSSAPIIQLIGSNPDSVTLGSTAYADPGAVANDICYGNLTASIVVTGTVDTTTLGSYTLIYTVTNSAAITASVTRKINVVSILDPLTIPQFKSPLLIPTAMPKSPCSDPNIDYYEIAMRQFNQQILPPCMPKTTVWGYGSVTAPNAVFNAPSLTIEAQVNRPVRIKWINDLIDANGNYLPPLLPIDQTLHWANPAGGIAGRDMAGTSQASYVGPVPIVTHVHGAHVYQESDGYPEAWYLPAAKNIPTGYATVGTYFDIYKATAQSSKLWQPGSVVFDYPNDQSASTIWYHDHALGLTRTNVYSGPAGFYLLRGGPTDQVFADPARTTPAVLPSTAPGGTAYEIPIAIQDRTFNTDGSLFYPDSRSYFDGFTGPYVPDPSSDIAPIWNPEFFGNTIIANGKTWPYQIVEQKQYRIRFLNGCQSRTLILKLSDGSSFWQIGSDGGFLTEPVQLTQLLLGPAERADVIIDFSTIPVGTSVIIQNIGPDGPFQGGVSGVDFPAANAATTGKVMEFRVVTANGVDLSTPVSKLVLPVVTQLGTSDNVRKVSLNEEVSVKLPGIGPKAAVLGIVTTDDMGVLSGVPQMWMSPITENVTLGDTETWEIYNFTMDAHPIHLHLVTFKVVERQVWDPMTGTYGPITQAQPWETGYKDTVLAYPGQITRIKAKFNRAGRYVWHCHILEHEDNEMMRPYQVLPCGVDGTAPIITILGNNPETVVQYSVYADAGATAMDNKDGNLTATIITVNKVNTAVPGMQMVHYTVTDAAGNKTMAMRMVMVRAKIATP